MSTTGSSMGLPSTGLSARGLTNTTSTTSTTLPLTLDSITESANELKRNFVERIYEGLKHLPPLKGISKEWAEKEELLPKDLLTEALVIEPKEQVALIKSLLKPNSDPSPKYYLDQISGTISCFYSKMPLLDSA